MPSRLEVTKQVFEAVAANLRDGDSFRYLIYDRLKFKPKNYQALYDAGGLFISDTGVVHRALVEFFEQAKRYLKAADDVIVGPQERMDYDEEEAAFRQKIKELDELLGGI